MTSHHATYLAEKFLFDRQRHPVTTRLAFDVWADRVGIDATVKNRLWQKGKGFGEGHDRNNRPEEGGRAKHSERRGRKTWALRGT